MKQQQKLLLLAVWLIALPLQLWAQDKKPFFNLKKGDWFVYQIDYSSEIHSSAQPIAASSPMNRKFNHRFDIKLVLTQQLPGGNQVFDVILERVNYKMMTKFAGNWFGFDSFYPTYTQAGNKGELKFLYKLEVSAKGEIVYFLPKNPDYSIPLEEISPKKMLGYNSIRNEPLPTETIKGFINFITIPHQENESKSFYFSRTTNLRVVSVVETPLNRLAKVRHNDSTLTIPFTKETNVPVLISFTGLTVLLKKASFLVPPNTVVKGRILNADSHKEKVVTGYNMEFSLSEDGSFTCPLFIENPGEGVFFYFGKDPAYFKTFFTPGDTLIVEADAANFQESLQLSGSAAPNTRLAMEVVKIFQKQEPAYLDINLDAGSIAAHANFQDKGRQEFNSLINSYSGKASAVAINFFKTEWTFLLAEAKLFFLHMNHFSSSPTADRMFQGFPQDFFLDLDTLPVAMNDFVDGEHYNNYFKWFIPYQQARLGMSSGGQFGFLSRYSIVLASLKQYPLYKVLAEELAEEIGRNSWQQNQRVKPYYEDYMANCRDTAFTNPLVKLWQWNESWAPGNASPIKTLMLADGSVFDLTKFKGKAVCLIVNNNYTTVISGFEQHIISSNPDEVHYVLVQVNRPFYKEKPLSNKVLTLPNVSYLEIDKESDELDKLKMNRTFGTSIFIFDKWLRVVENNLQLITSSEKMLDEPIKKAIEAKRFSNEQKAELMKTIGWSLGSILFAVIIGLFIYRNRLRTIRQQELVKRQMQELEIKAIRSQMNPHFVFNALNSIQSLINGNQFREANIYLSKFATLLRSVLHNSEKNMVPLSDELEAVKLYCQLEQLRFDFAFEMFVDEAINPNLIEIPPMIIQPLVENAIVHGLAPKGNEGELQIHISLVQGQLQVLVTDNGTGLKDRKTDKLSQKGFGLKLVQERINILSHEDKKASLSLQSAPAGEAKKTTSLLTIPID